jgi:hypothetical protein
MEQMIIANRLRDGLVVFLGPRGDWVEDISEGLLIDEKSAQVELEKAHGDEKNCLVIDPYLIEIVTEGGRRRPAVYREEIRAFGPSRRARTDLPSHRKGQH